MAKVILMKKAEISVPEGQKGKQLAVKESNTVSLKDFYKKNYQAPIQTVTPVAEVAPVQPVDTLVNEIPPMVEPIKENSMINDQAVVANNIIQEQPIVETSHVLEEPVAFSGNQNFSATPTIENVDSPKPEEPINITSGNDNVISQVEQEELDPELKEIKDRLDKVIDDLNAYKKKIEILEKKVNENLEKSKEVLKDTQAAAQIMSIQQERQKQINDEINGGGTLETDSSRILEKSAA